MRCDNPDGGPTSPVPAASLLLAQAPPCTEFLQWRMSDAGKGGFGDPFSLPCACMLTDGSRVPTARTSTFGGCACATLPSHEEPLIQVQLSGRGYPTKGRVRVIVPSMSEQPRKLRTWLKALAIGIVLLLVVGAVAYLLIRNRGFSAKEQPSAIEEFVARRVRRLAIPASHAHRTNPVPRSPDAVRAGLEHFADHCAVCHANDGSGQTEIGQGLYPKAPDMRLQNTQTLSDGELFYIIENGIRFTGMPAWSTGTPEGEEASWRLVHFIRHLPKLTPEEVEEMKALNPKSPDEWREEEEMRRFLQGEGGAPKPAPMPKPHGGHE